MTRAEAKRRADVFVGGLGITVSLVRCHFCGHEQPDKGRGFQCEECHEGPMPSASYGLATKYCTNAGCTQFATFVRKGHVCSFV